MSDGLPCKYSAPDRDGYVYCRICSSSARSANELIQYCPIKTIKREDVAPSLPKRVTDMLND